MTTIVKLSGRLLEDASALRTVTKAWKRRDPEEGPWVLVHGAGPQLDTALADLGEPLVRLHGLRVTSPRAADTVRATMDETGASLAKRLARSGVPTHHVSALAQHFAASPKTVDGASLGRVGSIVHFDAPAALKGVSADTLVIVSPVGWDPDGPLNVNADEGAVAVARALQANRLFLVMDVEAVLDGEGAPIVSLGPEQAEGLLRDGTANGGMEPKLQGALEALRGGVAQVRIGDVQCLGDPDRGTRLEPTRVLA